MSGDAPEGVGLTALGMAWVRLAESRRADRLFDDPYAGAFVAAAPDALPLPAEPFPAGPLSAESMPAESMPAESMPGEPVAGEAAPDEPPADAYGEAADAYGEAAGAYGEAADAYGEAAGAYGEAEGAHGEAAGAYGEAALAFVAHAVIRTRFYDDWAREAAAAGIDGFALLAAGLDTRAFRLDWPAGTRVFEADLPGLFAFKERVLAEAGAEPRCARTVVGVDLREDWPAALTTAGLDPARPTAWLVEGLFTYLTPEESVRLLDGVHGLSAPGSRIAFEHAPVTDAAREEAMARPEMARFAAMWRGGIRTDPLAWLEAHGWTARFHAADEVAAGLGRPGRVPAEGGFVTATRG